MPGTDGTGSFFVECFNDACLGGGECSEGYTGRLPVHILRYYPADLYVLSCPASRVQLSELRQVPTCFN